MPSRRLVVIIAVVTVALVAGSVTAFALWSSRQTPKVALHPTATASPTPSSSSDLNNPSGDLTTSSPSPTASETPTPPAASASAWPLPASSSPSSFEAKIGTGADGRPLLVTSENVPGAVMQLMTTTWTWDGSRWTALRSDPQVDAGGNLVYDSYLNRVVTLAGGITGSPYAMWGLDANGWANLYPETIPSRGLYPASVVLDPVHRQLVALVPEQTTTATWTFDGSTWTKAAPATNLPPRRQQAVAYDPATSTTVVYGGDLVIGGSRPFDDTWTWNGTTWTELHPATTPGGCTAGQLAYDAASRQMILFCVREQQNRSGNFIISTWAWSGTTWTQLHPSTTPPAAFMPRMTYDAVHQELVLFLGPVGSTKPQTWTYSNGAWKQAA